MKTTLMKRILFLTVMVFFISCGKDDSTTGGGKSKNHSVSPINGNSNLISPAVPQYLREQILQNFNSAVAWRNSTPEKQLLGGVGFSKGIIIFSSHQNSNCRDKSFWIFNFQICSGTTQQAQDPFTVEGSPLKYCVQQHSNGSVKWKQGEYNIYGCQSTGNWSDYSRGNNVELNKVLSLNNGTWMLHNSTVSNGVHYITVGPANMAPTHTYIIDTNIHSIYNPAQINDLVTNKQTQLYNVR